jgi:hypothetical protein
MGMQGTATLRRGPNIHFKESSRMLEKIFEFLYLGQICVLEEAKTDIRESDYNVWMFLLTWCVLSAFAVSRVVFTFVKGVPSSKNSRYSNLCTSVSQSSCGRPCNTGRVGFCCILYSSNVYPPHIR